MRSSVLLHRSRHLLQLLPQETRALTFSSFSALSYPRSPRNRDAQRTQQLSSSAASPPSNDGDGSSPAPAEKPRRRRIASKTSEVVEPTTAHPLPRTVELNKHDTLWVPATNAESGLATTSSPSGDDEPPSGLPAAWLLDEAYENLLLTLQPQTQHRAAYPADGAPSPEPTLTLYCPIEGGDYVIDATVRNIANRAEADVVVIDAIDLTAGEHGIFGKAAGILNFPDNPLQYSAPSSSAPSSSSPRQSRSENEEEDEDDDSSPPIFLNGAPAAFSIQLPNGGPGGSSRAGRGNSIIAPMARGSSHAISLRAKQFFDDLLGLTPPVVDPSEESKPSEMPSKRPRIVYIRDLPHIAGHASSWYPALLASVRARRRGAIVRSTSPVAHPTTIVFGVSAPISGPSSSPSSSSPSQSLISLLTGNRPQSPRASRQESWDESDDKARERRLKERLGKWQKGPDAIRDELPRFNMTSSAARSASGAPDGVFMLGGNGIAVPIGRSRDLAANSADDTGVYHRVVGIVPETRSLEAELEGRRSRRMEMNELAYKLAVTEAGGSLSGRVLPALASTGQSDLPPLLKQWALDLQDWRDLKAHASTVIGRTLVKTGVADLTSASIGPTAISWIDVLECASTMPGSDELRKTWVEQAVDGGSQAEGDAKTDKAQVPKIDQLLESVKNDPNLDQHEQRLLGCIVDPATMPTTFKQVHLPENTIDSIRTMVSLPLLYPHAFSSGILKTHAMTGALLFGPPGTGKTLLARAIARESGARMMIIKPSDVMDMYVGEGEKLVRSVFTLARRLSPCVVFLDEIDALFGARVSARESGVTVAHRGIITEFMQEMDGLKSVADSNVIVIGATNRPFDLDDAVLRRLPRRLLVDLPGPREREEILKILLHDEVLESDIDLTTLAGQTESFSGSDLKRIVMPVFYVENTMTNPCLLDLCIAAALDAVKEHVDVPWATSASKPPVEHTSPVPPPAASGSSEPTPVSKTLKSATKAAAKALKVEDAQRTEEPTSVPGKIMAALGLEQKESTQTSNPAAPPSPSINIPTTAATEPGPTLRTLGLRHFTKALREISPSASESLGTLVSIRKWNEQFGEGAKAKQRRAWGDRFGFKPSPVDVKIAVDQPSSLPSSSP